MLKIAALCYALLLALVNPVVAQDSHIVTVFNHTGHTFNFILGSHVGLSDYRYDFLGNLILPPHSNITINVDDGQGWCKFDLRALGDEWHADIWNMNVCVTHEWHIW